MKEIEIPAMKFITAKPEKMSENATVYTWSILRYGRSEQSSLAHHILNSGHCVDKSSSKSDIHVKYTKLLDDYESMAIAKSDNSMGKKLRPNCLQLFLQ